MMYIILNVFAVVLLAFLTREIDKNQRSGSGEIGNLVISLLLLTIESAIFSLALIFHTLWADTMTKLLMRLWFMVEAIYLVTLFFGLISIGLNRKSTMVYFLRVVGYIAGIYIVYWRYRTFELSFDKGIYIGCDYLFSANVNKFFPWTWVNLYNFVFKITMPTLGCFIMFILREKTATPLQKYQAVLIVQALLVMFGLELFIDYISSTVPAFSLLFIYPHIFFFVLVFIALGKTSVPSGRGLFFNVVRAVIAYIVPAVLVGIVCTLAKGLDAEGIGLYEVIVLAVTVGAVIFAWKIWDLIVYGSRVATNDYEANFEKGLANVNFTGEMDDVTGRMFEVFKNNVECSSMSIFIDDGHGVFAAAYSSNNTKFTIPVYTPVFDTLLNNNSTVVIYSEIEDHHEYDDIREPLKEIFENGKFDAMVILNEGHNILGIITLGKKLSGDHYKEYDKNVFIKLYSYFYVFGYYVRNISNKEVLGTVNREIRMSSQIITSIQENIDHIRSNKADVGYMMIPAHNIGGEFIDFIRLTDTRHLIVVGDLSGKGIAASMNMVILKSIIRTYLAETHDFKKLVAKINVFIREGFKKGTIFSGLFALVDFETDTMYYINCGVPALLMYTQVYNNVIEIQGSGHILGFVKDITPYLSVKTTKLNRGDIIMACTDGLIDSHSLRGEKFGRERVSQALLDNSTYPAQRMAQFTFESLRKFMQKEMEDDVSIFVLKYKTSAEFATPEEIEKERQEMAAAEQSEETENVSEEVSADIPSDVPAEESIPESAPVPDPVKEFEIPDFDEVSEESKAQAAEAQTAADDFFVEDISSEKKDPGQEFEFDPSAFGLPDDFTL